MKKLISLFNNEFAFMKKHMIIGNIILAIAFLGLSFGFFMGMYEYPLAVLLAWPFINIYMLIFAKSLDTQLEVKNNRWGILRAYMLRYWILLLPLIGATVLYAFGFHIFNPIVMVASYIGFKIPFFIPIKKEVSYE